MKPNPDREHADKIAAVLYEFAMAIAKDSGASGVRVACEFVVHIRKDRPQSRGKLDMKTFTTPDAKTERITDSDISMPRGSKLTNEAIRKMGLAMRKIRRGK